jgi:hypothetical protein
MTPATGAMHQYIIIIVFLAFILVRLMDMKNEMLEENLIKA